MTQFVKDLDQNLEYLHYEEINGVLRIFVKSARRDAKCPYCGEVSSRVHSEYVRKFKDLPTGGKKVEIVISNRKFFCLNSECSHHTFAETFDCLPKMGRRSSRLTEAILAAAADHSSIATERMMKESTADIGKSTICRLLSEKAAKSGDS